MLSIQKALESSVNESPFLRDAITKGIINYTGLARYLHDDIQKKVKKPVSIAAIVMSLQRYSQILQRNPATRTAPSSFVADISVRYHLSLYTFEYSRPMLKAHESMVHILKNTPNAFLNVSYGITEVSCVVSSAHEDTIKKSTRECIQLSYYGNLAAMIIHFKQETADMPGVYYAVLEALAWKNINCIELLSAGNELTLVYNTQDVQVAFDALQGILNSTAQ